MPSGRLPYPQTLALLCLGLLLRAPLFAGESAPRPAVAKVSSVSGSVYDEKAQPIAGVLVQIGGLAGKKLTTHTDVHGKFSAALEAGEYHIWLSKAGCEPVLARIIDLREGQNRPRFVLVASHEKGLQKLINSVAPKTQSPGAQARQTPSEEKQETHDVPDVSQALVDRYGEMRTPGAQANAGRYLIDSSNQSRPREFGLTSDVTHTSIRDLETRRFKSGIAGLDSDYSSAGRELSSSSLFREGRWSFAPHDLFPSPRIERGLRLGDWSPRLVFEGPVGQRIWISDTLSADHTLLVVRELPRKADSVATWKGTNDLRTQLRLSPTHLIGSKLLYSRQDDSNVGLTAFTPQATTVDIGSRRIALSAYDQHSSGNTLWEFGVRGEKVHSSLTPQGGTPYILYPGFAAGSYFETLAGDKRQGQAYFDFRRNFSAGPGRHSLQLGLDIGATEYRHIAKRNPFEIINQAGQLEQITDFIGNSDFSLHNARTREYVQDSWQLGSRLRLEGGLEWNQDSLLGQLAFAPRASVSFLPTAARTTKLFALWGIYYPELNLGLLGQSLDQRRIDRFYTNGVPDAPPQTEEFVGVLPKLRAPHYESYKTGIEQQLGRSTFIGSSLTWRYQLDGLAYRKIAAAKNLDQLSLLNDRRDTYRALEVSLRHDFGSAAEVFGSYTRSHTYSNQLFDFDLASQTYSYQLKGPLDYDAPNRVVTWAWVPVVHRKFILSYLLEYRTGFPFTIVDKDYNFVGLPNSSRFPDFLRVNTGLEKVLDFHGRAIGMRFAVVNMTNHRNPIAVDNNVDSPTFMHFDGGLGRSYTVRVRLLESK
jgi:hypothetical protein